MEGDELGKVTESTDFTVCIAGKSLNFRIYKLGYSEKWQVGDSVKISLRDVFLGSYTLENERDKGYHVRAFSNFS
jgi:hypothetical protein